MHTDKCSNTRGQKCAKGSGKEAKIQELCIEIQRTWNLKCEILPVITGATGIVTKGLKEFGIHTRKNNSIDSLKKTAVLEHHISYWK
jgi:hypothetical protein